MSEQQDVEWYTVAQVSRMTGIPESVLRHWHTTMAAPGDQDVVGAPIRYSMPHIKRILLFRDLRELLGIRWGKRALGIMASHGWFPWRDPQPIIRAPLSKHQRWRRLRRAVQPRQLV